ASKSVSQQGRNGNMMNSVMTLDPLTPPYYSDPSQFSNTMKLAYDRGDYIMTDPNTGLYYATSKYIEDDSGSPFIQMYKSDGTNEGINVRGTLYANLTFFKDIVFTSRFGYRLNYSTSHSYSFPYYANKQANATTYSISANANTGIYYQWENFANWNKTFGKHSFGLMAGMSYIQSTSDNVSASATGPDILTGYEENFRYLAYVNTNSDTVKSIGNSPSMSTSLAYYGRFTYNYDNRYNFQANFRADAFDSSKLSKDSRWGYFPSFSAGWTISNEPWFKDNVDRNKVSSLKFRASWGQNGNVNVLNSYQYATSINYNGATYQYHNDNGDVSYGSAPAGMANPNLKWETSEQIDLGLDARFLGNKLTFALDWYTKNTKDLIVSINPVPEIGVSSTYVNAGSVNNRGLELELGWSDNIGDFSYSVNANVSKLHNEVTYLDPSIYRLENSGMSYNNRMRTAFEVGYPIWYMRGYKYEGVDANGNAILADVNGDGQLGDADRTFIGKGIPDYTFGLTINMAYKGFDFVLYGAGTQGNEIMNLFYQADLNMRNSLRTFYDNAWTPQNTNAKYPSCLSVANDWNYWSSSACIFDGSYFKIKQIQLGYTLPTNFLQKFKIKGMRVFVSADDMFCFNSYPGCDPESATTGNANAMGLDYGGYPVTSKLVTGVNIKF
ncbi:MAG: SusC/RagA family TonB-linked outer membrane protein, partial [Bacteroidia bacterium]|nr:SusC/RagA family TonB-linked outer membrane protein [Bacteroidia bacterium]